MAFSLDWLDETRTIALLRNTGPWNWQELFSLVEQKIPLMSVDISHEVDVIMDASESEPPSKPIMYLPQIARLPNPKNIRYVFIVTGGRRGVGLVALDMLERIYKRRKHHIVDSFEEALEAIQALPHDNPANQETE